MKYSSIKIAMMAAIFLFGCSSDKNTRHEQCLSLASQYAAGDYKKELNGYTYLLQERFIDSGKLLCISGSIKDIIEEDSNCILKIEIQKTSTSVADGFFAETKITKGACAKLREQLKEANSAVGAFVIKVAQIIPLNGCGTDEDNDGGSYNYETTTLLFKGGIIDFIIYDHNQ